MHDPIKSDLIVYSKCSSCSKSITVTGLWSNPTNFRLLSISCPEKRMNCQWTVDCGWRRKKNQKIHQQNVSPTQKWESLYSGLKASFCSQVIVVHQVLSKLGLHVESGVGSSISKYHYHTSATVSYFAHVFGDPSLVTFVPAWDVLLGIPLETSKTQTQNTL